MYSLFVRRYGRNMNFDSLEELREELSGYFTRKQIEGGIVKRLTSFEGKKPKDGYICNEWQDFEVCYYPPEEVEL